MRAIRIPTIIMVILLLFVCISCSVSKEKNEVLNENQINEHLVSDADVKIGYLVSSYSESFAAIVLQRVTTLFEETHPEWDLIVKDSNYNVSIEYENAIKLINQGCDIMLFHAVDTYGSVPSIEACNDAGIPCITMVNVVSDGDRIYVGAKNYECGQIIANYIREKIPENGKICILMGPAGTTNSEDRVNGFKDNLNREDIIILDEQCGYWMLEMGESIMRSWLQQYQQIDLVFSCSDTMTPGAIKALKQAGRLEQTMVTSVDCSYEGLVCLKNGEYECDMFYNTITVAEKTKDICERLLLGETDIGDYEFSFELVTPDLAEDTIEWYFKDFNIK